MQIAYFIKKGKKIQPIFYVIYCICDRNRWLVIYSEIAHGKRETKKPPNRVKCQFDMSF